MNIVPNSFSVRFKPKPDGTYEMRLRLFDSKHGLGYVVKNVKKIDCEDDMFWFEEIIDDSHR